MFSYREDGRVLCSLAEPLPLAQPLPDLPAGEEAVVLLRRPPLTGRDAFALTHPRLLEGESVGTLFPA